MGFLRTILIFIFIYYIVKILMRMFAPLLAKKMMDKAAQNFENQFNNPYYKERPQAKEGETYIEKKPEETSSASHKKEKGEYVDFEELDE